MPFDISQMSRNGEPPAGMAYHPNERWWRVEDSDGKAQAIASALEFMRDHQTQRISQWIISSRLYGNIALVGRAGVTFSRIASSQPWLKERISWNCVQSASDTVTAKMDKNKPRALFLSSGGDYRLQRQAQKLTKFVDGVFYETQAYKCGIQTFLDGTIWGDGFTHVFARNGRVHHERVIASELWVDEMDGFYGDPRSMHRATDIDREVVLELAKEWTKGKSKKEQDHIVDRIQKSHRANPDNTSDYIADKITVVSSWHLPSGPDADDGKYVISIADTVLYEAPWTKDFFPFARFTWSPRPYGFWGQGLAEQLQNIQLEINTLLLTIKQSFWKGGTFRVFLPTGSRIVKEQITNQISSVISYSGAQQPTVVTPQLVQPEIFAHLQELWRKAFEQAGVSLLAAASEKPAGLNAAVALREYNDIQSDRFMRTGHNYEDYYMQLAKLDIDCARDIAKQHGGHYRVKIPLHGHTFEEVDWNEVKLDDDSYIIKCFPVSNLPQEPAGRLEQLTEWLQAGIVDWEEYLKLADVPDLETYVNLTTASERFLEKMIDKMIDEDDFTYVIEPGFDNLDLAYKLAQKYYQLGKLQNMDDKVLDKLRRFITSIDEQLQIRQQAQMQAQMQAQQAQQMPGAANPAPNPQTAVPQPTPQGQLLPFASPAMTG